MRNRIRTDDIPRFTPGQLEAICKILGDAHSGLTNTEIDYVFRQCGIHDQGPPSPKWMRVFNSLAARINEDGHCSVVLSFIRNALDPARYSDRPTTFEALRSKLNVRLAFVGLSYQADGKFARVTRASTLSDAKRRASELKAKLEERGVHPEVLRFCRAELVEDNYFHAVLEATKSVGERIRRMTGLRSDGAQLVDQALSGSAPLLRINELRNDSDWSEHRGFANLLKGMYGVFRNPTAHAPRIEWQMPEEDALDLLALASYAHRRLDRASVKKP